MSVIVARQSTACHVDDRLVAGESSLPPGFPLSQTRGEKISFNRFQSASSIVLLTKGALSWPAASFDGYGSIKRGIPCV